MEDLSTTSAVIKSRGARPMLLLLLLLASLTGCTNFVGTTAKSFMSHIQSDPDPNKRYTAYASLGNRNVFDSPEQKSQAVDLLIAKLDEGKEPLAIRTVICRTLGELRDPKARNVLIKTIGHPEGILRAEACRALGKIGDPNDASLLARVMTIDNLEDCRMAAIEGLGAMKTNDPRVIQILIDGMEHDDPAIRMASLTALRKISGKDLGVEPTPWRKHYEPLLAQATAPPATDGMAPPTAKEVTPPKQIATDNPGSQPNRTADPRVIKSTRP